jgi:predicted acylesterase/phospholipase RssA
VRLSDSWGAPVSGSTHLGLYRFSTDGSAAFDQAGVVAQLARAARSSASVPGAFVASRIDLGGGAVDMASVADFADVGGPASTRYVIDGGLVANEPLDQVYDKIRDQPSQGPVRRVICYVSPLSGVDSVPSSPEFDGPAPDLTQVLAATLMIPREQSIVRSLRAIVDESDERRALSRARRSLQVGPDAAATAELLRAAETLRPVVELQGDAAHPHGEADPTRHHHAEAELGPQVVVRSRPRVDRHGTNRRTWGCGRVVRTGANRSDPP